LQLNPKPLPEFSSARIPVHVQHRDVTRILGRQTFANLNGGRLASAVRPEKAEALSRTHLQVDAVNGDNILVLLPEIAKAKGSFGHRFGHTSSIASEVRGVKRSAPR
jgi:hypothetical protein